jgi:hypothetical protein
MGFRNLYFNNNNNKKNKTKPQGISLNSWNLGISGFVETDQAPRW